MSDASRFVPGLTSADLLAAKVSAALDAVAAMIPALEVPHPSTRRRVRGGRTVSKKSIISAIETVKASPVLQKLKVMDVDEASAAPQFIAAFRPVADQLALLLASVSYTIELRKAVLAAATLRTYAVAKALARDPTGASLISHIENIKRDLGRKRKSRGAPRLSD
jgi:hypothetical protein